MLANKIFYRQKIPEPRYIKRVYTSNEKFSSKKERNYSTSTLSLLFIRKFSVDFDVSEVQSFSPATGNLLS